MAPHSSTLAWRIPWTEEPGGLQSLGSQRVRHGLQQQLFTDTTTKESIPQNSYQIQRNLNMYKQDSAAQGPAVERII